jgi:hypothetical protein
MKKPITGDLRTGLRLLRAHWLLAAVVGCGLLVAVAGPGAWAAGPAKPPHQTVPRPTPTHTATLVPTVTPTYTRAPAGSGSAATEPTATPVPTRASADSGSGEPAATPAPAGTITAQVLNVRSEPSTGAAVVGKVFAGQAVQILGRNQDATWWFICCASDTGVQGWVSGQYVASNFAPGDAAQLVPLVGAGQPATPTASTQPTAEPTFAMQLRQSYRPALIWQGKQLAIQFQVTNPAAEDALDVVLRNALVPELILVSAQVDGDGEYFLETDDNGLAVTLFAWSRLAPGETVQATVVVEIAPETPDGAVIDNLAVASAANAYGSTAGITIGMPPVTLPDFH